MVAVVSRQSFMITVKVRDLPGEQPGGLKASGHAVFLDQAEPALDHVIVLRSVDPRVLMTNRLVGVRKPAPKLDHKIAEWSTLMGSDI